MPQRLKKLFANSGFLGATRFAGAGVGFLTQIMLAKALGASDLGIFYAATSLAAVAGIVAAQGYPQIAARFAARYRNKKSFGLFGRFVGQATRDAVFAGLMLALAVTVWALFWPGLEENTRLPYVLGGWMIVFVAITNIYVAIAGGMRHFGLCYIPEGLMRPVLFFAAIAVALLIQGLSAVGAVGICVAVVAGIAFFVFAGVKLKLPVVRWKALRHNPVVWRWREEAWLLVLLAVFTNFFADIGILVVVPFLSSADVAVFGLCLKLALLVGYFVQVAQQMAVPDLADARHLRDAQAIRRAARRSIATPLAVTTLSLVGVALLGKELLGLFGPQFVTGREVLFILVSTQVLRALAGPSSHLMTLNGAQKLNAALSAGAIALLVLTSMVFCTRWGIMGAGFAVLITYGCWLFATALVLRQLGEARIDFLVMLPRLQVASRAA
jgi:O-antigen/teichoic acid export membrane protein